MHTVLVSNDNFEKARNCIEQHVGDRIRISRLAAGLTLRELALRLQVSERKLEKYERGELRCPATSLFEIGLLLNVSVSQFFEGFDPADAKVVPR